MAKKIIALVIVFAMAFSTMTYAGSTVVVDYDTGSYVGFVNKTLKVKEGKYKDDVLYYCDGWGYKYRDVLQRYDCRFRSTNKKVATVDSELGEVYGKRAGTARIKVTLYEYGDWGEKYEVGTISHKVIVKGSYKIRKKTMKLFIKDKKYVPISGRRGSFKKWKSKNPRIAKVTRNGKVIAKRRGKTRITCKVKGKRKSIKVIVRKPYIIDRSIVDGASFYIDIYGHSCVGKRFRSSNPSILKVSRRGKMTAKRNGKATISCKSDGVWIKRRIRVERNQCTFRKTYKSLGSLYWGTVRIDPRKLYFSGKRLMLKATVLNKTDSTKRKLKYFKIKVYQNGKHILSKALHNKYVNVKSFRKKSVTWCLGSKRKWKRKLMLKYNSIRIVWDMYP